MNQTTKLKKAAQEVGYEFQMFDRLHDSFRNPVYADNQFKRNILIESFAIHAYCLYRFFYQGEKEKKNSRQIMRKSSDIIAEDFGINRNYFRNNRTPKKDLKIIEEKRHKQIAHLTYNRIYRNSRTKGWKISDIYIKLTKTIAAFLDSLSDKNRKLFN